MNDDERQKMTLEEKKNALGLRFLCRKVQIDYLKLREEDKLQAKADGDYDTDEDYEEDNSEEEEEIGKKPKKKLTFASNDKLTEIRYFTPGSRLTKERELRVDGRILKKYVVDEWKIEPPKSEPSKSEPPRSERPKSESPKPESSKSASKIDYKLPTIESKKLPKVTSVEVVTRPLKHGTVGLKSIAFSNTSEAYDYIKLSRQYLFKIKKAVSPSEFYMEFVIGEDNTIPMDPEAIIGELSHIRPVDGTKNWPVESRLRFRKMVEGKIMHVVVDSKTLVPSPDESTASRLRMEVSLYSSNKSINIQLEMIRLNLAKKR